MKKVFILIIMVMFIISCSTIPAPGNNKSVLIIYGKVSNPKNVTLHISKAFDLYFYNSENNSTFKVPYNPMNEYNIYTHLKPGNYTLKKITTVFGEKRTPAESRNYSIPFLLKPNNITVFPKKFIVHADDHMVNNVYSYYVRPNAFLSKDDEQLIYEKISTYENFNLWTFDAPHQRIVEQNSPILVDSIDNENNTNAVLTSNKNTTELFYDKGIGDSATAVEPNYANTEIATNFNVENRYALVIGNGNYKSSPLKNPINDAKDISSALQKLGFDVTTILNGDRKSILQSIRNFSTKMKSGSTGLFYYAGHGVQVDGNNYLIPLGADIQVESDIEYEAIQINRVISAMKDARIDTSIIILDACRNNPYASSFRSSSRGLSIVQASTGSLVIFSTQPGNIANDGDGRNGLFTEVLLKYIGEKNVEVNRMLLNVRKEVAEKTHNKQIPFSSDSLLDEFFFNPQ